MAFESWLFQFYTFTFTFAYFFERGVFMNFLQMLFQIRQGRIGIEKLISARFEAKNTPKVN